MNTKYEYDTPTTGPSGGGVKTTIQENARPITKISAGTKSLFFQQNWNCLVCCVTVFNGFEQIVIASEKS